MGDQEEDIPKVIPEVNICDSEPYNINNIINFNNYKNIKIGTIFKAIIIKMNNNCIVIYIEDLDNKYSLHISKLSKEKLIYENNKLLINENNCILYKLFDKINVKLNKIDFEILDFEIFSGTNIDELM